MAVAVPLAQAETLTVADGTETSNLVPVHGYYYDSQGKKTQMIYPESMIEDMKGSTITGVKFYCSNSSGIGFSGGKLTFTIGTTTQTTFSSATAVTITGTVSIAEYVPATGDTEINLTFDTPFEYNEGNIIIQAYTTTKGTCDSYNNYTYFYGQTQTSASYCETAYYGSAQVASFLPKATFSYEGSELPDYGSKLNPDIESYDFGTLAVGNSSNLNFTLRNTGANAFTPSVTINGTGFSTTYTSAELLSKTSVDIPVTFSPTTAGELAGTLTIACGEAGSYTINLIGAGVNETIVVDGTATDAHLPVYGLYYDEGAQTNQMIYPASELGSLNGKKITSMTFYSSSTSFFSGGKVTFSLANLPSETSSFSSASRLEPDGLTKVYSAAVPDGITNTWTITFDSEANFVYDGGNLLIDVQTESGTYKSVSFYGQSGHTNASWYSYKGNTGNELLNFLPKVKFEYEDATPQGPTITVNPATLNINAALGETKTASFTVTGTNLEGDITVAASEGFTVEPTTIAATDGSASATVTVTYVAPAIAEEKTGTITLTSENADNKTVTVNATAADVTYDFTVDEESLDFGTVMVGQNKALSVTIRNNGSDNIQPVFTFNNNVFTVEDSSYPVFGGLSQTYNIVYTPLAAGTDNGTVTINVGSQSVVVNLTGVGKELADYDITSTAASGVHNFGDAFVNGTASWSFTITNNGKNAVTPTITGLEAPFSTTYTPAALAAGESVTITISFGPTEIQAYGPTSITVTFPGTEDFQFDYTLRGNGIENTGTLPPSYYDNIPYTWTDSEGNEHTSLLSEIATDPDQMIALMREVYTNKNLPGPWYRGYDADGNVETAYPVAYPAIGTVSRYGTIGVAENYTYDGSSNGWNIPHDEANYPFDLLYHNSSSHNYYKALNGNEYKPNEEGLTLLLVEMKDGVTSSTVSNTASLRNVFSGMFKSVRVITNSKRVTNNNGVEGTLFKIDCDKMNRFFFLGKGRLRLYNDAYVDNTHLRRSNFFIDKDNQTSTLLSITNVTDDKAPFYEMFEQFSPVSLTQGTEAQDIYQELVNMVSYPVEHDCEYIPWATTQSSSGASITGHEFNMYGKTSISADCQDVRDLMFFVPDQRMKYWGTRDKGVNDKFVNYYEEYAPTMGLYVIRQNEIVGGPTEGKEGYYTLTLSWDSNLTDFVPSDKGVYYIYQVNDDGSYTLVGTTDSQTKTLEVEVQQDGHGKQVTYVIQGQDNTRFLSLQFSNEESFIIPGTDPYEKFQLDPNAEYYSRYNPADEHNYYANGMQIKAYPGVEVGDFANNTVNFYRKAVVGTTEGEWTKVAEVTVNSATAATLGGTYDQRAQADYQYGYQTNPSSLAVTTNANGYKVFDAIYDNFKADVSANEHPDYYKYIIVVGGTPDEIASKYHSNEITIRIFKTKMSTISGTFTDEQIANDVVRTLGLETPSFDIDVEHSSKTEVLRYGAYRWDAATTQSDYAILDGYDENGNEQDISPSGQASNQGEYYSVYMNGDSYIGDNVYVAQGETGQATFVDDVPTNAANANEYTYVPVVETFTGRSDYNTYGAPMQTTATGKVIVAVDKQGMSEYTWEANNNTYRYYNVFVKVNTLDLPAGYEVAKVRAWRKIDASYLGEETGTYAYRAELDTNGEFMFDDPATASEGVELGGETVTGNIYKGTFGAIDVESGTTIPMEFVVRVYFTESAATTNSPRIKAEGDSKKYYITETTISEELANNIPTSIFGVESVKEVAGIKYYNMAGMESDVPFNGVNIEVTRYTDGTRSTRKVMK